MSAIQERERRVTAGKRINFLAGQELEQDEAFWGHDTWQEDSDSFHSSDVVSQEEVDEFDSDFDLSENDNETTELEEQIGAAAERDIALEERELKKRSGAYVDTAKKKGITAARGKKGVGGGRPNAGGKRVIGEGLNAGIVLNVPLQYRTDYAPSVPITDTSSVVPLSLHSGALPVPPVTNSAASVSVLPILSSANDIALVTASATPQVGLVPRPQSNKKVKVSKPTLAATRVRRKGGKTSIHARVAPGGHSRKSLPKDEEESSNLLKRGKQAFTQEEMLIEAVQMTEPENERWILGRKRSQAEKDDLEQFLVRNHNMDKHGKLVEKFVSRHGYLNTITFPDMDHLPDIIKDMSKQARPMPAVKEPVCAITGNKARYRDPKSGLGYYDIAAFRELRRRYEDKELNLDPIEASIQNGLTSSSMDEATMFDVGNSLNCSSTESNEMKTASIRKTNVSGTKRKALEKKPHASKKTVVEAIFTGQNGCELPSSKSNGTAAHQAHTSNEDALLRSNASRCSDGQKHLLSPPLSPGRKSPRNRKPTSKVAENVLVRLESSLTSLPVQSEASLNTVIAAPIDTEIPLTGGET